jgi:hypothetical protein
MYQRVEREHQVGERILDARKRSSVAHQEARPFRKAAECTLTEADATRRYVNTDIEAALAE